MSSEKKYRVKLNQSGFDKFNAAGTPCWDGVNYLGRVPASHSFGFGFDVDFAGVFGYENLKTEPSPEVALATRNEAQAVKIEMSDVELEEIQ